MEKNLFSDLTPQQMSIKNTELLQNYIRLYETLQSTYANINNIHKSYSNARIIEFISNKTAELRDMVGYAITDSYITKTYVENLVIYKQHLLVLTQINAVLKSLAKPSKE